MIYLMADRNMDKLQFHSNAVNSSNFKLSNLMIKKTLIVEIYLLIHSLTYICIVSIQVLKKIITSKKKYLISLFLMTASLHVHY